MKEENKKSVLLYVIISIAIIIYLGFINTTNRLLAILISIIYLIYAFEKVKTFNKYIKVLIYPLTEIVLLFSLLGGTGDVGSIANFIRVVLGIMYILLHFNIIVIINAIEEWVINKRKKQHNIQVEEENKKECKKFINSAWFYIIISIAIILYLEFIVVPYGEKGHFLDESGLSGESNIIVYILMTWPIFIIYYKYTKRKIDTFSKKIKILIYPLAIYVILCLAGLCLSVFGGSIGWLIIILLWSIIPGLPFIILYFLIKKINSIIKKRKNKKLQEDKKEQ